MSDQPPAPIPGIDQPIKGGFVRAGAWQRGEASGLISLMGDKPLPREAAVYAYAVSGVVRYVGSAQRGARNRLRHYEIAKTLRTAHRIRQEVLTVLAAGGEVKVFAIAASSLHWRPACRSQFSPRCWRAHPGEDERQTPRPRRSRNMRNRLDWPRASASSWCTASANSAWLRRCWRGPMSGG